MKTIFKMIMSIIGILYLGVIIFVTGCLLFYNQYKVTQINDKTFIIIDDKSDMYKDGDLVIFTKNPNDEIVSGDEIFFYEITNGTVNVVSGTVTNSEKITDTETTFTINGSHKISSENVIGKTVTANTYPNIGKILYVFESRFGFLLLVILPALIFFFYEIYRLVQDIKATKEGDQSQNLQNVQSVEPAGQTISNDIAQSVEPVNQVVSSESVQNVEPVEQAVSSDIAQSVEPVEQVSSNEIIQSVEEASNLDETLSVDQPTTSDVLDLQSDVPHAEDSSEVLVESANNDSDEIKQTTGIDMTQPLNLEDKKDL